LGIASESFRHQINGLIADALGDCSLSVWLAGTPLAAIRGKLTFDKSVIVGSRRLWNWDTYLTNDFRIAGQLPELDAAENQRDQKSISLGDKRVHWATEAT
jgi:hypothetical protein